MPTKLFKPGQSGNPKGRPPMEDCWAGALRKVLDSKQVEVILSNERGRKKRYYAKSEKGTIKHAVIGIWMGSALKGNLTAINMIMDRTVGKPAQNIKVEGLKENPLLDKLQEYEEDNNNTNNPG